MLVKLRELGYRSYGLELTGPRVARSSIATLDYYPKSRRLILSDLCMPGDSSSDTPLEDLDQALIDFFEGQKNTHKSFGPRLHLVTNAPLSFPPLFSKKMGASAQTVNEEIEWMLGVWKKLKNRPKAFLDYVHRPVEIYLRHLCPERFAFADSLGSNQVLLAARMLKLKEHLPNKQKESFPKASFQRMCRALKTRSFVFNNYNSLIDGLDARKDFLTALQKKLPQLFIFDESFELMVLHIHAFQAFILALTGHLEFKEACERPPQNFPKKAHWMLLPKSVFDWERML